MAEKQSTPQVSPLERVQTSIKHLSKTAATLNTASDELGKAIDALNAALQRLNLGVSAWVTITKGDDFGDGNWWSRDIGYAKIRNQWGIALRECSGNYNFPPGDTTEEWLFNEGPRWLRSEAVAKIPDLIEALIKQAEHTTNKINKSIKTAHDFANMIATGIEQAKKAAGKVEEV